jgi:hypothetical protein
MRSQRRLGLCLTLLMLLVYALFPTRNYYWDGVGFALAIEDAQGLTSGLFNPNHLLYNFFGYLLYQTLHWLTPDLRALYLLSICSILSSIGAAYLLFSMLMAELEDSYYSVCLTLLFAFSATWWKFSTDANVYVPSVFFLLLAASKLRKPRPNWAAIGLIHAVSVLLHQIAIFFYPVVLVAILRKAWGQNRRQAFRDASLYTAIAGGFVILSYSWVWLNVVNGRDLERFGAQQAQVDTSGVRTARVDNFLSWLLSHGNEEYSFRSLTGNLQEFLRSNVHLFFGGRISLALRHIETPLLVILGVVLVCSVGLLAFTLWQSFRTHAIYRKLSIVRSQSESLLPLLLTWIGSFAAFLFLWLTEYPYYRLFYLPALILLLGILLKPRRNLSSEEHSYALASFVAVMILINFTFLIYPYSKPEATPPLDLALKAKEIWNDDVIYYADFNCDNWMFKYFNKRTTWRPITFNDLQDLREEMIYLKSQGKRTWIDATAFDQMQQSSDLKQWFADEVSMSAWRGLSSGKHRIKFSLLVPRPGPYILGKGARIAKPANTDTRDF